MSQMWLIGPSSDLELQIKMHWRPAVYNALLLARGTSFCLLLHAQWIMRRLSRQWDPVSPISRSVDVISASPVQSEWHNELCVAPRFAPSSFIQRVLSIYPVHIWWETYKDITSLTRSHHLAIVIPSQQDSSFFLWRSFNHPIDLLSFTGVTIPAEELFVQGDPIE